MSHITVCSSLQGFCQNRMGLWSNKAIAYNLHCEITATKWYTKTSNKINKIKFLSQAKFLLSRHLNEILNYTNFITIPAELDLQVTGVVGDLVPSPRIFLAGGPLASLLVRFLLIPVTCLPSEVFSGFGSVSRVGITSAGVTTGTAGGSTAS